MGAVLLVVALAGAIGVWALAAAVGEVAGELKGLRQALLGMDVRLHERDREPPVAERVRPLGPRSRP